MKLTVKYRHVHRGEHTLVRSHTYTATHTGSYTPLYLTVCEYHHGHEAHSDFLNPVIVLW